MNTAQQQILNQIFSLPEKEQWQIARQLLAKSFRSPEFSLAGSVSHIGDLDAGKEEIRKMANEALQRSAEELHDERSENN